MKRWLLVVSMLAVASLSAAQQGSGAKGALKLLSDLTDVLKTVKDKASAEDALPKLKALDKKVVEQLKADSKFSKEEEKLLDAELNRLDAELNRLDKLAEAKAVFKELTLFKEIAKSQMVVVKVQILTLDRAVTLYLLKNGEYPKSLKALTEGDRPLLKGADSLLDPWKKPYQYEVAGPKNKGEKPDIWTVTPDNVVIGNWEKK